MAPGRAGDFEPILSAQQADGLGSPDGDERRRARGPHACARWAIPGVGILSASLCALALLRPRAAPAGGAGPDVSGVLVREDAITLVSTGAENCSNGSALSKGHCVKCHAGRFANSGSTECSVCPAGRFAGSGSSECSLCPAFHYSFQEASRCKPCPGDKPPNAREGGQCDVDLCGHTCAEVVHHMQTELSDTCTFKWKQGCKGAAPPAPFTADTLLSELCPVECEHPTLEDFDHRFTNANEGHHAACRGKDENDNNESYFTVFEEDDMELKTCMGKCATAGNCTGIEFQTFWGGTSRCEVWTATIGATFNDSLPAPGFMCYLFDPTAKPPNNGPGDSGARAQTAGAVAAGAAALALAAVLA